jgi:hypothetical protein
MQRKSEAISTTGSLTLRTHPKLIISCPFGPLAVLCLAISNVSCGGLDEFCYVRVCFWTRIKIFPGVAFVRRSLSSFECDLSCRRQASGCGWANREVAAVDNMIDNGGRDSRPKQSVRSVRKSSTSVLPLVIEWFLLGKLNHGSKSATSLWSVDKAPAYSSVKSRLATDLGRERIWYSNYGNRLRHPTPPAFLAIFIGLHLLHQAIDETSEKHPGQSWR